MSGSDFCQSSGSTMSNPKDDASGTAGPRRFKLIPNENLSPEQRKLYDAIRSGPRAKIANSGASTPGPLGGPFNVWLRSPGIGDCVQRLGEEIRFRSSLPPKLNEMAIIVTARFWTSQYEWYAHCKLALDARVLFAGVDVPERGSHATAGGCDAGAEVAGGALASDVSGQRGQGAVAGVDPARTPGSLRVADVPRR